MVNQEVAVLRHPLSPWEVLRKRILKNWSMTPVEFSDKHGLDVDEIVKIFNGEEKVFTPALCKALHAETGISEEFFKNLSDRYQQAVTS